MKYLFMLSIIAITMFSGCSNDTEVGPQGIQGPQGVQGEKGDSGYVFEWENVSFTAPDYQVYLQFGGVDGFEGLESDVALVYFLWGVDDETGFEIWRALPQTLLLNEGTLIYNYDHTLNDVKLFMESDFSLNLLGADYTDNWVVRVVVVPGSFWSSGRQNIPDYYDLEATLGLPKLRTRAGAYQQRN